MRKNGNGNDGGVGAALRLVSRVLGMSRGGRCAVRGHYFKDALRDGGDGGVFGED